MGMLRANPSGYLKANAHYKPNQTFHQLAQAYESFIQLAPMTFEQVQPHLPVERTGLCKQFWNWTVWISPNAIGKIFYKITVPLTTSLEFKCNAQTNRALLQTMIALRLYALDHNGELPDSLTAIVPQYLSTIPLDDFDGKAIRYSKAHRIIYSVGKNLKDNGGVFASPTEKRDTPHIDLAWK